MFLIKLCFLCFLQDATGSAKVVATEQSTKIHACSSAKNAVQNVDVFLLVPMHISKFVLATITGRPRKEDQNALELFNFLYYSLNFPYHHIISFY